MINEAADRIERMEQYFDALQRAEATNPAAIREDASLSELLRLLVQYYEGGQWMQDYELDEKGLLPPELKRGILAQDAVYDFLERMNDLDRSGWTAHHGSHSRR